MRIGELAALAGVSTRTVRHYHHLGLLPEPARRANGYRDYRLRDAVALARIRRLAETGLSLDEVRDVLADDRGRDLREVLTELDADLARQQEAIAARRARLATLLAQADLHPDAMVSAGMAAVLRDLPAKGSKSAEIDRELLTLMDSVADASSRDEVMAMLDPLMTPDALARGHALYERLDELAAAEPDDPRVAVLAADLAAHLPAEMATAMIRSAGGPWPSVAPETPAADADDPPGSPHDERRSGTWRDTPVPPWLAALGAELSPAQAEVFRLALAELMKTT